MVAKNRQDAARRLKKDIGSYRGELDNLQAAANDLDGVFSVQFRDVKAGVTTTVGNEDYLIEGLENGSTVMVYAERLEDAKVAVKGRFLKEEATSQNPSFAWESMPEPRVRTLSRMLNDCHALEEFTLLKKRSRKYRYERKFLRQVCRLGKVTIAENTSDEVAVSGYGV